MLSRLKMLTKQLWVLCSYLAAPPHDTDVYESIPMVWCIRFYPFSMQHFYSTGVLFELLSP